MPKLKKLKVNEIFYSIQGEGARAGNPSIFIRLTGCDKTCGFCDTEFESGKLMSVEEILLHIQGWECKWIVWTGGEPALQLTEEIVDYFKKKGYRQCIETNGGSKVPENLDWVSVSPKVAEHVLEKNFPKGVTELRYVRHKGHTSVPSPSIGAAYYFLSPQFDGNMINYENLDACIKLCQKFPQWNLSVQLHKLWKVN